MTSIIVNGKKYMVSPEHMSMTLLSYLRDILDLTGTKCGCSAGVCGTCKVLIDGKAENSCLVKMSKIDGNHVTTIEGIGTPDKLDPIQKAFIECGAIQCGFCTPGMIIVTKELLDRNSDPDEETIKKALDKNLCRCTGYVKIIEAVRCAARLRREEVCGRV